MNIAIILAAGKGVRTGLKVAKQFYTINNKTLLSHCLDVFLSSDKVNKILIATSKEYIDTLEVEYMKNSSYNKIMAIVEGGKSRQESVYKCLIYLEDFLNSNDKVIIHDSARPMLSINTLEETIDKSGITGSAVACIKTTDTIATSKDNLIDSHLDRQYLYNIQTPQVFRYDIIKKAHDTYSNESDFTDDSSMVKSLGQDVSLVISDNANIKITNSLDIDIYKLFLKKQQI